MRIAAALTTALGVLAAALPARAGDPAALNRAAGLYHQARYDSARVQLDALLAEGGWRKRDSLVMLQYLGMAWTRLGSDSAAVGRFSALLAADSLFRLPRNEDPAILRNLQAARDRRNTKVTQAPAAAPPPVQGPAVPEAAVLSDHGAARPSPAAAARSAFPSEDDPLRAAPPPVRTMNLALGAVPLGGGWLARKRTGHGLTLGLLQAGGLLMSLYASEMQDRAENDFGGREPSEEDSVVRWQWVQRVSLSTALGAYLYSIIASGGD